MDEFDDAAVQDLEHSLLYTVREALGQDPTALTTILTVVFAEVAAKAMYECIPNLDQGHVDFVAGNFKQNLEVSLLGLGEQADTAN